MRRTMQKYPYADHQRRDGRVEGYAYAGPSGQAAYVGT